MTTIRCLVVAVVEDQTTNKLAPTVELNPDELLRTVVPEKVRPFDVYVAPPLALDMCRPFPDLSFHCSTLDPLSIILFISAASSHNEQVDPILSGPYTAV